MRIQKNRRDIGEPGKVLQADRNYRERRSEGFVASSGLGRSAMLKECAFCLRLGLHPISLSQLFKYNGHRGAVSPYFLFIYFTLQYCIGFAIHQHESAMGVHVFPILKPPSHLPPHPIPLGHPSAPAPSTLSHASNLHLRFVSHVIIYMFQCDSPKSSHPRPLPQSPKDCSMHLCLFCCLAYRVIVTIFLNSIYMC